MEFIILLFIAGVVLAIILGGTYLTCQRVQNYCALESKREELVTRLVNSRLGKMLRSLNISLQEYLRKFPDAAITSQLSTCQNCEVSTACDAYLADEHRDPDSARNFCPNMNEFDRLHEKAHDRPV